MAISGKRTIKSQENRSAKEIKAEKVRVQFDFSRLALEKLDELVAGSSAHTRAEIIRRALQLFSEYDLARRRGAEIILREPNNQEVRLLPLW